MTVISNGPPLRGGPGGGQLLLVHFVLPLFRAGEVVLLVLPLFLARGLVLFVLPLFSLFSCVTVRSV